ncbi:ABC transporter permease [Acerihabitans arboris]|uniref:ABC transporter permease subunit n=1 Tax=Acerihabitans arboris TaxID=2691583 RepID=A0A845SLR6_9GAMM|nr:ABC transporter permease subunit [Acerihabitans arboris]NDL65860.1 ABC transporter permease subunit [Acerihabitans arboris]
MTEFFRLLTDGLWGEQLIAGAWLSIKLALSTLPFGLVLGLLLAKGQDSHQYLIATGASVLATVFRGLPELMTIFIVYYGGQIGLSALLSLIGWNKTVEISAFFAGMLALGLVFGAFSSEVFKAAMHAIPRGQKEASHALGLSLWHTYKNVILPQMWRVALPGIGNLWMMLLKDTALVSLIALPDLMRVTNLAVSSTRLAFEFYLLTFSIYLLLSIISGHVFARLETRANRPFLAGSK